MLRLQLLPVFAAALGFRRPRGAKGKDPRGVRHDWPTGAGRQIRAWRSGIRPATALGFRRMADQSNGWRLQGSWISKRHSCGAVGRLSASATPVGKSPTRRPVVNTQAQIICCAGRGHSSSLWWLSVRRTYQSFRRRGKMFCGFWIEGRDDGWQRVRLSGSRMCAPLLRDDVGSVEQGRAFNLWCHPALDAGSRAPREGVRRSSPSSRYRKCEPVQLGPPAGSRLGGLWRF